MRKLFAVVIACAALALSGCADTSHSEEESDFLVGDEPLVDANSHRVIDPSVMWSNGDCWEPYEWQSDDGLTYVVTNSDNPERLALILWSPDGKGLPTSAVCSKGGVR